MIVSDAGLLCIDLEPTPGSVREVRHAVDQWMREVGADAVAETARLLVSELATNAVRHAGESYTVEARWRAPRLRVDVIDGAPAPGLRDGPRGSEGGWGLQILEKLADAWGIEDRGSRKTVWFELQE